MPTTTKSTTTPSTSTMSPMTKSARAFVEVPQNKVLQPNVENSHSSKDEATTSSIVMAGPNELATLAYTNQSQKMDTSKTPIGVTRDQPSGAPRSLKLHSLLVSGLVVAFVYL